MFTSPSGFGKRFIKETGVAVPEEGGIVPVGGILVGIKVGVDATGIKGVGVAVELGSAVTNGNAWEMATGEGSPAPIEVGKLQATSRIDRAIIVQAMRNCFIVFLSFSSDTR